MKHNRLKYSVHLAILLVMFFCRAQGQNHKILDIEKIKPATNQYNYATTIDEEIIYFKEGKFSGPAGFTYFDTLNEKRFIKEKKIISIHAGDQLFLRFPETQKRNSFTYVMEVAARNDKYILALFIDEDARRLGVYDYDRNQIVELKIYNHVGSKKANAILDEKVRPYFNNCRPLIERMEENIRVMKFGDPVMTEGVHNIICTDQKSE